MNTTLLLLALCLIFAGPGLWLLLRHTSAGSTAVAVTLLLLATACAYTGGRLWLDNSQIEQNPFVLQDVPGQFQIITPTELPAALEAAHGRPVLLEFYADWCPSCLVWKDTVFNRADVQAAMSPLVLLQIDATELTPETQALLDQYELAGLPAMLVYDMGGRERPEFRLLGEMPAADFIQWINETLIPAL